MSESRRTSDHARDVDNLGSLAPWRLGVLDDHDIVRLEISVDDSFAVGSGHSRCHLADEADGVTNWQLSAPVLQAIREGVSCQKLHHDVGPSVRKLTKLIHIDDAGVGSEIAGSRLVEKTGQELWVIGDLFVQHFDGDASTDLVVHRLIDHTHAPLT